MKSLFAKLKTFFDAYKMYVFFMALLFGTNGAQFMANSEPTSEKPAKTASTPMKPQKTVIIHKSDNEYVDRKLEEHKRGSQH